MQFYFITKIQTSWLINCTMVDSQRYLSTSPNFGAGLVLKKLGPHTNLKTDIECLCSTIVYFTSHELDKFSRELKLKFQDFSMFKFFFSNIFSVFSRFGKKCCSNSSKSPENPKKHSVDIIVLYTLRRNSFSCNFGFSKLPRLKKGHLVNISKPRPSASASKIFYSLPFFQPR